MKKHLKRRSIVLAFTSLLFLTTQAKATVVQIQTVLGNIDINLFDQTTPETVRNFLSYVNSGAYMNNVMHRSEPGFVVQAGGFRFDDTFPPVAIPTDPPVINEPVLSNLRGTIAMAKAAGNPNSATSQWFISLADNSANLDVQNGGFTVFGQVLGDGMEVVDAIAALERFNAGGAFNTLPVRDFTQADVDAGRDPEADNLVIITDVIVIDSAVVTNPDIVPVPNTLLNAGGGDNPPNQDSGSGGGTLNLLSFALLGLVLVFRGTFKRT
ncbi:peptidylprolyl isomerase [Alteromonadaceae bacterium M269]|nr:peptidylprolyl isomerase [Alteromonadaceae bacterium M269]